MLCSHRAIRLAIGEHRVLLLHTIQLYSWRLPLRRHTGWNDIEKCSSMFLCVGFSFLCSCHLCLYTMLLLPLLLEKKSSMSLKDVGSFAIFAVYLTLSYNGTSARPSTSSISYMCAFCGVVIIFLFDVSRPPSLQSWSESELMVSWKEPDHFSHEEKQHFETKFMKLFTLAHGAIWCWLTAFAQLCIWFWIYRFTHALRIVFDYVSLSSSIMLRAIRSKAKNKNKKKTKKKMMKIEKRNWSYSQRQQRWTTDPE